MNGRGCLRYNPWITDYSGTPPPYFKERNKTGRCPFEHHSNPPLRNTPESLKKTSVVIEVKGREGGLSIVEGPQNKLVGRGFDVQLLVDLDSKDARESGDEMLCAI